MLDHERPERVLLRARIDVDRDAIIGRHPVATTLRAVPVNDLRSDNKFTIGFALIVLRGALAER
ncbi:hypothetical protein GCM10009776_37810 [Microbacterium deminutum]|uniref:Uncharacterized protein n=1 Tax=Microbacterium deminutum TaxID=344164 RepID=A0ABN2RLX6_9MICO